MLDPAPQRLAGFTMLAMAPGQPARIDGCLERREPAWRLCAPVVLDTGGVRVTVWDDRVGDGWRVWPPGQAVGLRLMARAPAGAAVELVFASAGSPAAPAAVAVGPLQHPGQRPFVNAGQLAFGAFAVLYNAGAGEIGLARR